MKVVNYILKLRFSQSGGLMDVNNMFIKEYKLFTNLQDIKIKNITKILILSTCKKAKLLKKIKR